MKYTNSINGINIIDEFDPVNGLILVRFKDFMFKKESTLLDLSEIKNFSNELCLTEVVKGYDGCTFKEGDKLVIDIVMLSQFAYIFENHPNIDPELMIAPEKLFLLKVDDDE